MKWKNNNKKSIVPLKEIKSSPSTNSYLPDIQAFPDIPQLADVDINASFELDNSNNSMYNYRNIYINIIYSYTYLIFVEKTKLILIL